MLYFCINYMLKFTQKIIIKILHSDLLDMKIVIHTTLAMRKLKHNYLDIFVNAFYEFSWKNIDVLSRKEMRQFYQTVH